MTRLFIDTWGWLTLNDSKESRHIEATAAYQQFWRQGGEIYTTDYVLDETYTLLFKRLPAPQAAICLQSIFQAVTQAERFHLVWFNQQRFTQAQAFRLRYLDKPRISFTDLTSMVVMQEFEIQKVLTEDAHFEHVGLGFQRVP